MLPDSLRRQFLTADLRLKSVLVLILASQFQGLAESRDSEPIFTGEFLVNVAKTDGRAMHALTRGVSSHNGWTFKPLDEPDTGTGSHYLAGRATNSTSLWFLAIPPERQAAPNTTSYPEAITANAWQNAHDEVEAAYTSNRLSLRSQLETQGIEILNIEPNFAFPIELEPRTSVPATQNAGSSGSDAQIDQGFNPAWPNKPVGWQLGSDYSQLAEARAIVAKRNGHQPHALIAHLDTGYDPKHISLPRHFLTNISISFDPSSGEPIRDQGAANQSGHGTGTLALLAGKRAIIPNVWDGDVGGAPDENVFEVRINDTNFLSGVVHFSTASMYEGILYASRMNADVVSISAGGIPSQLWSDAVNTAYQSGTAIFAASGDYLTIPVLGLPFTPYHVVYPAAFSRVLAVTGVTCQFRSYGLRGTWAALLPQNWNAATLRGSWGPAYEMLNAIAAYTPNVLWAEYQSPHSTPASAMSNTAEHRLFRIDGGGTSASTPQVAAAAALWIAFYGDKLPDHHSRDAWQRAEAVYTALERASSPRNYNPPYRDLFIGKGLLRAADALKIWPLGHLTQRPPAQPAWTWIGALNPVPFLMKNESVGESNKSLKQTINNMYSLEAAQLIARSDRLRDILDRTSIHPDTPASGVPAGVRVRLIRALIKDRRCSPSLRTFLNASLSRQASANTE